MIYEIRKENIFAFFKDKSFIQEINEEFIVIKENKKDAKLRKVEITNLNKDSKYWIIDTESKAFQLQGKKVENIIVEQTKDNILNIIMIELKSARVRESEVQNKFKNSLSFIYILLHLLQHKTTPPIKVFGILFAQKDMRWNDKNTLKIFSSTAIRYIKRSFYTNKNEMSIEIKNLIYEKV